MAAPPTLLMACLSVMAALAAGAGSGGHGSHADLAQARHYCRNMTWHEFRSEKCVRRRSLAAISESTIECDAAYESQEFQQYADYICHDVCPIFGSGELQCGASHHAASSTDRDMSMMWGIAFLSFALIMGALGSVFLRRFMPFMPYTVFLLLFGIILGLLAYLLSHQASCPSHAVNNEAFDFESSGHGEISRAEYDYFQCHDCVDDSICKKSNHRSCPTCKSFDRLDVSVMYTPFDPARYKNAKYSTPTEFDHEADGVLTRDELWTAECDILNSFISIASMDPHLLLVVFLPPLLFESAYAMDDAIFGTQIVQILLLAIPGVVISSLLTALLVWALYWETDLGVSSWDGYGVDVDGVTITTYTFAWLAGTILSATDPVAVVALLKELGASKTLGTLIEGESLCNDGSAVVLFTFIFNLIKTGGDIASLAGTHDGWLELLRIIAQMLLFGPVFGWAAARLLVYSLKTVYNDMLVEVAMIVGATYFVFWTSEVVLKSAAVLSVVTMGYIINQERLCISVTVHEFLHHFFEMVAWMLNTVIFLICGIKLGEVIGALSINHVVDYDGIRGPDILKGLAVYVGVNIVRLTSVTIFSPLLKRLGTGFDWRTGAVVVWGGLRGSVGLALALVVLHAQYAPFWGGPTSPPATFAEYQKVIKSLPCRDVPVQILMLAAWIVLLTVVINGSTMAKLIEMLRLDQLSEDRKFMLDRAMKKLRNETNYIVGGLKHELTDQMIDWTSVKDRYDHVLKLDLKLDFKDEKSAALMQAFLREEMSYREQHEKGEISDKAAAWLQLYMTRLNAQTEREGGETHEAATQSYAKEMKKMLELFLDVTAWKQQCRTIWPFKYWAEHAVFEEIALAYEVGASYIKATKSLKALYEAQNKKYHDDPGVRASSAGPNHRRSHHDADSCSSLGSASFLHHTMSSVSCGLGVEVEESAPVRLKNDPTHLAITPGAAGGPSWTTNLRNTDSSDASGVHEERSLEPISPPRPLGYKAKPKASFADMPTGPPVRTETMDSASHLDALGEITAERLRYARELEEKIKELRMTYPDEVRAVETRQVAVKVLRKQQKVVEKMQEHGELSDMDAAILLDSLNEQRKAVHYMRPKDFSTKDNRGVLADVPAFAFLVGERATEEVRSKHVQFHKWQEDCRKIMDKMVDTIKEKTFNGDDVVCYPPESTALTASAASSDTPAAELTREVTKKSDGSGPTVAASKRRRRSVVDKGIECALGIGVATAQGLKRAASGGQKAFDAGRATDSHGAEPPARETSRGVAFLTKQGSPDTERTRTRSASKDRIGKERMVALTDMYDRLIIVKSGQLAIGDQVTRRCGTMFEPSVQMTMAKMDLEAIMGGRGLAGAMREQTGEPRKLGPSTVTGLAFVLQCVDLEELDQKEELPTIRCTRAANVMSISGSKIREAIRNGSNAGLDLLKELWCMHAKETATRLLRQRDPFKYMSPGELGEYIERGWLLEWDDDDEAIEVEMLYHGILLNGQCEIDKALHRISNNEHSARVSMAAAPRQPLGAIYQAPKMLRAGDLVRAKQPVTKAHVSYRGTAKTDPVRRTSDVRDTSGQDEAAATGLPGHSRIRIIVFPNSGTDQMVMEAPTMMPISVDPEQRNYGEHMRNRSSAIDLRRRSSTTVTGFRRSLKMQSSKNLLSARRSGDGNKADSPMGSMKNMFKAVSMKKLSMEAVQETSSDGTDGPIASASTGYCNRSNSSKFKGLDLLVSAGAGSDLATPSSAMGSITANSSAPMSMLPHDMPSLSENSEAPGTTPASSTTEEKPPSSGAAPEDGQPPADKSASFV